MFKTVFLGVLLRAFVIRFTGFYLRDGTLIVIEL